MEATANSGKKIKEMDIETLTELLMTQLIKLDGIVAEGDLKQQRRTQVYTIHTLLTFFFLLNSYSIPITNLKKTFAFLKVRRVQKHIETLDMLKLQNSSSSSNGSKTPLQEQPRSSNQTSAVPKQRNLTTKQPSRLGHSESFVVSTKWETFE